MAQSVTYQPAAVKVANEITAAIVLLAQTVLPQVRSAVNNYSNNAVSVTLHAMTTTPLNADGSLGTADTSPVSGDFIDPRAVQNFSEVQTPFNYDAAFGLLQQMVNLLTGAAVTQQSTAPNILSLFAP